MIQKFLLEKHEQRQLESGGEVRLALGGNVYAIGFDLNGSGPLAKKRSADRIRQQRRRKRKAPATVTCKRCPGRPVFRTQAAFMRHRRKEHRQKVGNGHTT